MEQYMVIGDYFNNLTNEDMMKTNETLDVVLWNPLTPSGFHKNPA